MRNLLFLLLFFVFAGCQTRKADERPNIILFFSDELAPEYVSAYGGNIPTPHIDRLAETGIRFTNAHVASPMCTPSRFALITGKYPGRCVHPDYLEAYTEDEPYVIAWNTFLEGSLATIPQLLSENGYFTGMTGKWHLGNLSGNMETPEFPDGADPADPSVEEKLRRFQEIVVDEIKRTAGFDYASSVLWGNFDVFPVQALRYHNFPWITHGAIKFLEEASKKDQPFFLYAATTAVHGPGHTSVFNEDLSYTLEGRIEEVTKYQLSADSMKTVLDTLSAPMRHKFSGMADLDNHVHHVLNKLKELGLEENTIIVFVADHNVEPGKATCYEKGLHVPYILRWPGKYDQGTVNDQLVSSVDLLPTFLEAAGIPLPENSVFDGISLMPMLDDPGKPVRETVYAESGLARSINDGRWKYIAFRYPDDVLEKMRTGEINYAPNYLNLEKQAHSSIAMEYYPAYFDPDQLYDLRNDPYEQNNLAYEEEYQDKLNEMQEKLRNYLVTFDHPYDLGDTVFMRSEKYSELVEKSRSYGTDWISWFSRDHGVLKWPPER